MTDIDVPDTLGHPIPDEPPPDTVWLDTRGVIWTAIPGKAPADPVFWASSRHETYRWDSGGVTAHGPLRRLIPVSDADTVGTGTVPMSMYITMQRERNDACTARDVLRLQVASALGTGAPLPDETLVEAITDLRERLQVAENVESLVDELGQLRESIRRALSQAEGRLSYAPGALAPVHAYTTGLAMLANRCQGIRDAAAGPNASEPPRLSSVATVIRDLRWRVSVAEIDPHPISADPLIPPGEDEIPQGHKYRDSEGD